MTARRWRLADPLPILIAAAVILVVWQLVATLYFNANVTPQFRDCDLQHHLIAAAHHD